MQGLAVRSTLLCRPSAVPLCTIPTSIVSEETRGPAAHYKTLSANRSTIRFFPPRVRESTNLGLRCLARRCRSFGAKERVGIEHLIIIGVAKAMVHA